MYKINYFNFKEKENNYLLTNDFGNYVFIDKNNFSKLVNKEELDEDIRALQQRNILI